MALFASDRERRLWLWTLIIIATIYATLGLASVLADFLYHQGLVTLAFLAGMLFVGLTVLTQGLKVRPHGVEIAVFLGLATIYFMVFLRLAIPERSHLIEYGVVAVFIYEALSERASQGRRIPTPGLLAIAGTTLVGAVDECIQIFLPSRVFDVDDMLFNFLAAVMAISASGTIGFVRRKVAKSWTNAPKNHQQDSQ